VPREKLPALVAALKLGGWPLPKDAAKKPGPGPAGRAPATVPFGAEAAQKRGAASLKNEDDASAAKSQHDKPPTAREQAAEQRADLKQAPARDAQKAPTTRQIRIFLKVKPNK
jgi:hypothetical protein